MIPLCFPKISMNLWVHLQFLKNKIEIKLLHSASTEGVTDSGQSEPCYNCRHLNY
ncbi:MAG: hypothetical protein P8X79_11055 [Reinekea sp.]